MKILTFKMSLPVKIFIRNLVFQTEKREGEGTGIDMWNKIVLKRKQKRRKQKKIKHALLVSLETQMA